MSNVFEQTARAKKVARIALFIERTIAESHVRIPAASYAKQLTDAGWAVYAAAAGVHMPSAVTRTAVIELLSATPVRKTPKSGRVA